ncbi:MAG: hypothetical protein J7604_11470 [Sporocytophaga sp.]|uniref:hypothetical protein n=1 Tax=Sporocytophaga sp. TaxID=2231183 RepID=UPI001AFE4A13|nr:hypothetical protein [Sporocytophaga sp.]MBO9700820.1 hypothetical protein [Sporocytophaga sp.]
MLSIEPLNVYEIKIKTTTPSLTPSIFKAISEQFEYYNLEEILEKISNTNGYNERYLGILNDVAVNGEKVDFRVVNLYSEAIGGDPDIRASVPWYIYNNSHYWLPCIDFVLKAFQKENVERVKISISGALEMIIKDFLENTISSFYNEGIFENAFGTPGNDFNNTLNKLLNSGGADTMKFLNISLRKP